LVIELKARRLEMVSELISDDLLWDAGLGPRGPGVHEGDSALVVHDVQRLADQWVCSGFEEDLGAA
jgi:hypothetical protein